MDKDIKEKIEAATFRRLLKHFQENPDIQNIDLMELDGFCRNCISKWYSEESKEKNLEINYDEAKELVYGMPYKDWKDKHQEEQSSDRIDKLSSKFHNH
jgi:DNA phosphorothioation-dependent restriction protein DptG